LGYVVRTSYVKLHEWSEGHECLTWFSPVVKNSGRLPALINAVEIRLENSTNCFWTSYPAGVLYVGHVSIGLVKPGENVEVGYFGGPAPSYAWTVDSATTYLRMDELEGRTFKVTITLRDGENAILAENTFIHTFSRPLAGDAVSALENFLKAFNDNDAERMWDLLSANQRRYIDLENFRGIVRSPEEEVLGQRIGTLELKGAVLKGAGWGEVTLTVEIVEHRVVLKELKRGDNIGRPPSFFWENRDLRGRGEVRLTFENGWKIDVPVTLHPDPAKAVLALGLEVEAPAEIETGDGLPLKFEIRNKSFLPITIWHAHTPARAILYRGEDRITQFPQAILDILTGATLGPFGSQAYKESIPPLYKKGEELHTTFSEPGIYKIVPSAEFGAWWEPETGRVEPHKLQAPPFEIDVKGAAVIYLSRFDINLLDFFGRRVGNLSGKFQIGGSGENVEAELVLGLSSQAVENLRIDSLVLDTDLAFYGFFEKGAPPPPLPPPEHRSIALREGERVILLKRTRDVGGFNRPMFLVTFGINSIRVYFSDGQLRVLPCGMEVLPSEAMELQKRTELHFHDIGVDLAIELDNFSYRPNSEVQVKVTNLTNKTLTFQGDKYDICFERWLKEEKHWGSRTWVETPVISLPPGQSHVLSYRLENFQPGRYRVLCHSSSAQFWVQ
jgi:hypothetical protein